MIFWLAGYQARLWPLLWCKTVHAQQNRGLLNRKLLLLAMYIYNTSVATSSACLRELFFFGTMQDNYMPAIDHIVAAL